MATTFGRRDARRSALALLAATALTGCTHLYTALANVPATFGELERSTDIAYGGETRQRLDVYSPEDGGDEPRPIVVFLHGGGWEDGSRAEYRFVGEALVSRGFIAVLPDYRLYPDVRFPVFIEDAALAVRWAHEHAAELGADPDRLFLMGHSAGAHIAAMLNFDERYLAAEGGGREWIRGFIGLSGAYDFLPFMTPRLREIFAGAEHLGDTQPVCFVDGGEPPTLLLHGEADDIVWPRNSRRLAAAIRSQGGRVAEIYYPDFDHVDTLAAMTVYLRGREPVLDEIERFVREQALVAGD